MGMANTRSYAFSKNSSSELRKMQTDAEGDAEEDSCHQALTWLFFSQGEQDPLLKIKEKLAKEDIP